MPALVERDAWGAGLDALTRRSRRLRSYGHKAKPQKVAQKRPRWRRCTFP
jgi:hypothetical protein